MKKKKSRLSPLVLLSFVVCSAAVPFISRAALQGPQSPSPTSSTEQNTKLPQSVPGEILVRFRKGAAPKTPRSEMLVRQSGRPILLQVEEFSGPEIVEGLRLARVAPEDTTRAIEALRSSPDVLYAEPNFMRYPEATPNDPRYSDLWGLKNTGQGGGTVGADIKAEQAWDTTTGNRNVVVAIIDQGIDINHPDLTDNIWRNPGEIPGNSIDDDGNGFVDDVNGYDFVHNDSSVYDGPGTNPDGSLIDFHGTHVAGTIGATGNNNIGVVGVNWQASLMSLKFLGPQGGTTADLLKALSYAKMMRDRWVSSGDTQGANIRVTNNSYGGGGYSQSEIDAIQAIGSSGILFVAAAGNSAEDNGILPSFPASYDLPNVISVAATDRLDHLASFTNRGASTVHLAAPGVTILSTYPGNGYSFLNGTSMASPHVAGAAALVLAVHPDFSVARLRAALLFGTDPLAVLDNVTVTGGRLNAAGALQNASEVDTTPPAAINDLHITAQVERYVTLNWTATGDDGNAGRARLCEIRFADQNNEFLLAVRRPADAGTAETINVRVPFRHSTGSFVVRQIDNAGNTSNASVSVAVTPDAADPYSVTVGPAAPLSTGGQALGMHFDDNIRSVALPFSFPFFERYASAVYVSTNGALYFEGAPTADPFSSTRALNSRLMIAGLWDDLDLRTCFRSDSDVYEVIPDPDRVIFRWQGVRFSSSSCPMGTPVPLAVNFEVELRRDGTIQTRYGENTPSLPVVGLGGGEPEGYLINTHSSDTILFNLTNAQTLTFALRRLPNKSDLAVSSSGPNYVFLGTPATFNLTVTNQGPISVSGVVLTDTFPLATIPFSPPATTFVSCSSSQGTCSAPSGSQVQVDIGSLAPGNAVNVAIVLLPVVGSPSTFTNSGSVAGGLSDLDNSNNVTSTSAGLIYPHVFPQSGIIGVGGGGNQSFAIRSDGYGLAWGANSYGQLGNGSTTDQHDPTRIIDLGPLAQIDSGSAHTLALRPSGAVWSWGRNDRGQLGDGTTVNHKRATKITTLSGVTKVSAGGSHSLALRNDGTVWAWGDNSKGQLGIGSTLDKMSPVQVPGLSNVTAISAGYNHSLAVTSDGAVWSWGGNESGQLGETASSGRTSPAPVNGIANVVAVAAGKGYVFVDGNNTTTISFSCALRSDGGVWAWGSNWKGQLGDGTTNARSTPGPVSGLANVSAIAAGGYHAVARISDGTLRAWGGNTFGQIGDTTRTDRLLPVSVAWLTGISAIATGSEHTLAVRQQDGNVFNWGSSSNGQLGWGWTNNVTQAPYPFEPNLQLPDPLLVGTVAAPTFSPDGGTYSSAQNVIVRTATGDTTISSVFTGGQHLFARLTNGEYYGWGNNDNAQLGFDPGNQYADRRKKVVTTAALVPGLEDFVSIKGGFYHTVALKNDGTVWTWGSNQQGQLGDTAPFRITPGQVPGLSGVVSIGASFQSSVAVKNDGTVWCWGQGQLNDDGAPNHTIPTQVIGLSGIVGGGGPFIRNDGTLWGWGYNQDGGLGDGTQIYRPLPVRVAIGLDGVIATAFGVALKSDGTVWTWGSSDQGRLGTGESQAIHLTPVQVTGVSGIIAIAEGSEFILALKSDGTVWGWGRNPYGELGDGTNLNRPAPVQIQGLSGITKISAGQDFGVALRADGTLFTWGKNDYGQQGDGTIEPQFTPTQLTQVTGGVAVHYTTNGNDPTEDDPILTSGQSAFIDNSLTLKARAYKNGWMPSAIKSAAYTVTQPNAIDDPRNFIRQQYLDFLNREPDPAGWDYWTSQISQCGIDAVCIHQQRIVVSAAFFIELEFQLTGSVVYRLHRAAYGTMDEAPTRAKITYAQFIADRAQLVGGSGLPQSTIDLANNFVQRAEFRQIYADGMSPTDFVNALFDKASLTGSANLSLRQAEIDAMNSGRTRAQVLLDVIEIQEFKDREYKPSFVLMQYFGYLRRDAEQGGYDFWLNILNNKLPHDASGYRAMVCAFITSAEYQLRFGSQITHTNQECN